MKKITIYLTLAIATTLLTIGCSSNLNVSDTENSNNTVEQESQNIEQLNITVTPHQSPQEQQKKVQILANYLQEQLKITVKINVASSYEDSIKMIASDQVQMAYLGSASYVKAKQENPNLTAILAPIETITGRPWYKSVIVVNSQKGINSITDLQGKKISFVNESSTSGYLVPSFYLVNNGIDLKKYFSSVNYAGSHDQNVVTLKTGKADAIAIDQQTFLRSQKSGELPTNQYKIIWQSDPIPNPPIVVNTQLLSSKIISELKKALVNAPEGFVDLTGSDSNGYTIVEDKDYDPIRDMEEFLKKQSN